ncbi:MAG: hypothetical protein KIT09_23605 [Bryobacteraceae bacterium]|nr:hypothetical protein [Bryobacteraceae bacterium]
MRAWWKRLLARSRLIRWLARLVEEYPEQGEPADGGPPAHWLKRVGGVGMMRGSAAGTRPEAPREIPPKPYPEPNRNLPASTQFARREMHPAAEGVRFPEAPPAEGEAPARFRETAVEERPAERLPAWRPRLKRNASKAVFAESEGKRGGRTEWPAATPNPPEWRPEQRGQSAPERSAAPRPDWPAEEARPRAWPALFTDGEFRPNENGARFEDSGPATLPEAAFAEQDAPGPTAALRYEAAPPASEDRARFAQQGWEQRPSAHNWPELPDNVAGAAVQYREARPASRPAPAGYPETPFHHWPELPEGRPPASSAKSARAWERRRRLEREQAGLPWNE